MNPTRKDRIISKSKTSGNQLQRQIRSASTPFRHDEATLFLRATACFSEAHIAVIFRLHEAGAQGSVGFQDLSRAIEVESVTRRIEMRRRRAA